VDNRDWKRLRVFETFRSIVMSYMKIKNAFISESQIDRYSDEPVLIYQLEKIENELRKLKVKLESYKKLKKL